ncbi:MAG: chromate transporter [Clostridiales bacterium]|nr:chromate transporter [Clostridiales bacterium]
MDKLDKHGNKLVKLFTSTMLISTFTFGGGYVIVPLMKKKFVDELRWLQEDETLDYIAIAQSSPGAVAVNASILLGYRIAGVPGALVAILGTILPPMVILSVISYFYLSFQANPVVNAVLGAMRAGVAAVIINVVVRMGWGIVRQRKIVPVVVMLAVFAAVYFFKVSIILIILLCAALGVATALIESAREKKDGPSSDDDMRKI